MKLDGVKSVTLQECDQWLARLYEKPNVLRSESVESNGVITLDQASSLMMQSYRDRQSWLETDANVREIKKMVEQIVHQLDHHPTLHRSEQGGAEEVC